MLMSIPILTHVLLQCPPTPPAVVITCQTRDWPQLSSHSAVHMKRGKWGFDSGRTDAHLLQRKLPVGSDVSSL